ncbi:hypothetical protein B0T25DRAFT_528564 [Lasiosphaeria hispida]|uniref:Uncharacterized protein n=1 Tax=Lasiosphaeria hispida TaxID=260671 RepID=A0AAJ0HWH1_9PEZI|nr:hypothetical protein B0T25DRAFT_528564 [Lasiosphaeria hispida]
MHSYATSFRRPAAWKILLSLVGNLWASPFQRMWIASHRPLYWRQRHISSFLVAENFSGSVAVACFSSPAFRPAAANSWMSSSRESWRLRSLARSSFRFWICDSRSLWRAM